MSIPPVAITGGILLSVAIILLMDKDSEPGGSYVILQDGANYRRSKDEIDR
jgi:hypothetical protein